MNRHHDDQMLPSDKWGVCPNCGCEDLDTKYGGGEDYFGEMMTDEDSFSCPNCGETFTNISYWYSEGGTVIPVKDETVANDDGGVIDWNKKYSFFEKIRRYFRRR